MFKMSHMRFIKLNHCTYCLIEGRSGKSREEVRAQLRLDGGRSKSRISQLLRIWPPPGAEELLPEPQLNAVPQADVDIAEEEPLLFKSDNVNVVPNQICIAPGT